MSIEIYYKSSSLKKNSENLVLFTDEKFNISPLKKTISNSEYAYITDLINISDKKKNSQIRY